jgi:2-polyprenyl-3-methyl-5-hydroxy-6-metoxy-1,4-benzoquinol methylase
MLERLLRQVFARTATSPDGRSAPADPVATRRDTPGTQHAWQQLAGQAGVQSEQYPDNPRQEIQLLFAHPPQRVLDIGCATGAVGLALKQAFPGCWVWGCELNPGAAAIARGRLDLVSTRIAEEWSAADLGRLGTVDTLILADVLEHMYNPWAHLQFLAAHLSPHAQVIVSLPNVGNIDVLAELSQGGFEYRAAGVLDVTHIRFFTPRGMATMFEQTGFRVELATPLSHRMEQSITSFPAQVVAGKATITVETARDWDRLNAVQFGFRLRVRRAAAG